MIQHSRVVLASALLLLTGVAHAFVVMPNAGTTKQQSPRVALFAATDDDNSALSALSRRDLFSQTAAVSLGLVTSLALGGRAQQAAWASSDIGTSPEHPIVVLGAGGKVGKFCTQLLAEQGFYVRATTRSGRAVLDGNKDLSQYISYAPADVTKPDTLQTALAGASAVIFAASASGKNKGGDPISVDYLGAYNTAKASLDQNVPKLVVVSAAEATRPESIGFKATNFFVKYIYGDHIMDAKIAGENAVREVYAAAGKSGYTIVRPGGLNDKESVGPAELHVSQGDVYAAEISRKDVALVTIAAALKGSATDGVTFEINQKEGLYKALSTLPDLPAELVHAGASSFDALLDGLVPDRELKAKYPDLINDFRGDGIPPLQSLIKA